MPDSEKGALRGGNREIDRGSVCRDFLRNVCERGSSCRFRHPEGLETKYSSTKEKIIFCHDFQNKECTRPNCKFLHCTIREEEYYLLTGTLPSHALEAISSGKGVPNDSGLSKHSGPVCKDFLKGSCHRSNCKFRHVSFSEYETEILLLQPKREIPQELRYSDSEANLQLYRTLSKHFDQPISHYDLAPLNHMHYGKDYHLLEEENIALRRKVEEYKKQVLDLQATNEVLLQKNVHLRLTKQRSIAPPLTATIINAVDPVSQMSSPIAQLSHPITLNSDEIVPVAGTQPSLASASNLGTIVPLTPASTLVSASIAPALPSQALINLSNSSTTLISYPVMTQSMRPIVHQNVGQRLCSVLWMP